MSAQIFLLQDVTSDVIDVDADSDVDGNVDESVYEGVSILCDDDFNESDSGSDED